METVEDFIFLGSKITVDGNCSHEIKRHLLLGRKVKSGSISSFSHVQFFATPWTVACQAPLSIGFSRQEYWSELPFSPPGDFPNPGIEPTPLMSPALAGGFFTTSATWEVLFALICALKLDMIF